MFVRFRQSANRLQFSLVETRRSNGKVQHEHLASLGSIAMPPSVADRIEFWRRLNERLAKLSNRVDAEAQGKIRAGIYDRVPMPTIAEQQATELENAEAEERFWLTMHDMNKDMAEGFKKAAADAETSAKIAEAAMADAAEGAAEARDRIERLKRGESVPGLTRPLTPKEMLRRIGWTKADLDHAHRLQEIEDMGAFKEFVSSQVPSERRRKAASRAFLRRKQLE